MDFATSLGGFLEILTDKIIEHHLKIKNFNERITQIEEHLHIESTEEK